MVFLEGKTLNLNLKPLSLLMQAMPLSWSVATWLLSGFRDLGFIEFVGFTAFMGLRRLMGFIGFRVFIGFSVLRAYDDPFLLPPLRFPLP